MDLDLEVKQLARQLKVCDQAIINLEMNRNQPKTPFLRNIIKFIKPNVNGSLSETELLDFCFKDNPSYPTNQNALGKRL
jgi:hypothetical protein